MSAGILQFSTTSAVVTDDELVCSRQKRKLLWRHFIIGFMFWMLTVATVFSGFVAVAVGAETPDVSSSLAVDMRSDITDPQNLLGAQIPRVTDAISSVKEQTGVTVRLLYLTNFTGTNDPDKWAGDTLQSTNPPANTVLLAVASNDGRLVVAVSHNSDGWLKDKDHVAQLSQAALDPIQKGDNPDWPGSACAMMDKIKTLHEQEVSKTPKIILASSIVFGIIVLAVIVVLVMRRRKAVRSAGGKKGSETNNAIATATNEADGVKGKAKRPKHRRKH
ncbi:TPM domain-containing protein [Bifidobacterium commune]|nr:hypothetical protein [Bifidobacterium commune]